MAFTATSLAIAPLLDTTFISDMKLIINANTTLLQNQIEDVINELEIDLVNKYIGVDNPVNKIFSKDEVISNSLIFKAGASSGASTIASLTQALGVSTFLADNVTFTKTLSSTAAGSKIASPTVVIGTDSSNISVVGPSTGGVADKGLYVGDATTPIKTRLYGEVEMPKQAVIQSYSNSAGTFTPRAITLVANGTSYVYAKLVLAKTDPQFIYVDLIFPVGYSNYGNPIWLLLHESVASRPSAGQTFTVIVNKIYQSDLNEVTYSSLPAISNQAGDPGINIICGADSDTNTYKRVLINSATWTTPPASDVAAVAAIGTDALAYYVRLGNYYNQSSTVFKSRGTSISFTKTENATDYSNYTITNTHNTVIIN